MPKQASRVAAYFKELVSEGQALEKQGKDIYLGAGGKAASSKIEELRSEFKSRVDSATGGRMDKVVDSIEKGRAQLLGRVGIPSPH